MLLKRLDFLFVSLVLIPLLMFGSFFFIYALDSVLLQMKMREQNVPLVSYVSKNKSYRPCYFFCLVKDEVYFNNNKYLVDGLNKLKGEKITPIEKILGVSQSQTAYLYHNNNTNVLIERYNNRMLVFFVVIGMLMYLGCVYLVYVIYPFLLQSIFFKKEKNTIPLIKKIRQIFYFAFIIAPLIVILARPIISSLDNYLLQSMGASINRKINLDNEIISSNSCFYFCKPIGSVIYNNEIWFINLSNGIFKNNESYDTFFYDIRKRQSILVLKRSQRQIYINLLIGIIGYFVAIQLMLMLPRIAYQYSRLD